MLYRKNMGSKESWARMIGGALIVACSLTQSVDAARRGACHKWRASGADGADWLLPRMCHGWPQSLEGPR
jgi:hypothetical protein